MIEENRAKFFNVSLRVPVEHGLPQGYKGLIVISLDLSYVVMFPGATLLLNTVKSHT